MLKTASKRCTKNEKSSKRKPLRKKHVYEFWFALNLWLWFWFEWSSKF